MRTKPILCCPTPAGVLTRINWMGGGKGERRGEGREEEGGREERRRMGKGEVKEKWKGNKGGRGGVGEEEEEKEKDIS